MDLLNLLLDIVKGYLTVGLLLAIGVCCRWLYSERKHYGSMENVNWLLLMGCGFGLLVFWLPVAASIGDFLYRRHLNRVARKKQAEKPVMRMSPGPALRKHHSQILRETLPVDEHEESGGV